MPLTHLSPDTLYSLQPVPGRPVTDYFDPSIPGLRLRILTGKDGSVTRRSWAVTVKGRLATIGTVEDLTLDAAKKEADRLRRGEAAVGKSSRFSTYAAALRKTRWYSSLRPKTRALFDYACQRVEAYLKDPPIHKLTRRVLQEMVDHSKPGMGRQMADAARCVLEHAVNQEVLDSNPARGLKLARRKARSRTLNESEMKALLVYLRAHTKRSRAAVALRLSFYTCCRPGEAAWATVDEFRREDRRGLRWTVPEGRSKEGNEITRPLSSQAEDLILPMLSNRKPGELLLKKRLHRNALRSCVSRAMRTLGLERFAPHDIRRTSRTVLSMLGVKTEVKEILMGHVLPGIIGTYDQYSYDSEKVQALQLLGDELDRIEGVQHEETLDSLI